MDKTEIVKRGVELYGKAEEALAEARAALLALEPVYRDGAKAEMLKGGETVKTIAKLASLAGRIGEIEEKVYDLHDRGTMIAKQNDADFNPGGFVILGGGDR